MIIFRNIIDILFFVATAVNLFVMLRFMHEIRWMQQARLIIFAYEKELIERGVTLPPRCPLCCQILPGHVEGCDCAGVEISAKGHGRFIEWMTRPVIKYFRDGSQPPDLRAK